MLTFLALGFLIGLRHALEPDHVAAVVSLSTRGGTLRDHARSGALWGLGHALTLLVLAGSCVVFGLVIPERAGRLLEGAVGVMLVVLGIGVLARLRRSGIHVHPHTHDDGTTHVHAHGHAPAARAADEAHAHAHPRPPLRTLGVGALHGLAGSSALVLLVGSAAASPALGLAYVLLFGLGAVVGMTVLAATVALPMGFTTRRRTGLHAWLCGATGAFSIVLGLRIAWTVALG
jgi:ABC-type nickel/cobalt efflux system permease component RcnA